MSFKILSIYNARELVDREPLMLNVISAETTEMVDPKLCKNHLALVMDDVDDNYSEMWGGDPETMGVVFPEKRHIIEAVLFDKRHGVDLIHCHAGISRSTAIGYSVLRGRGMSKWDALNEIYKIVPSAMPNRRIVRFADEIYGRK